ncbi:MAG: Methylated-DNA--protein-cysteine methyltransferase [Planctomycetes bacterium]|nr:Methylated-DNA--protein-cysteine methyltransferase [Planctomycetota bacterium]HRJ77031.1 methylated-DNA--[protein]-cysteine S-methyltransferase [Planctomycetota bacterium]
MTQTCYLEMPSPIGKLTLTCSDDGITGVHMDTGHFNLPAQARRGHPLLDQARRQLEEYFAGRRKEFELPLAAQGTEFQRRVWARLCDIPFGETASYGQVAARVGKPKASRAVGLANGANPIGIIVPCHRVIGADGKLTGYGGGTHRKQWLLDHESKVTGKPAKA